MKFLQLVGITAGMFGSMFCVERGLATNSPAPSQAPPQGAPDLVRLLNDRFASVYEKIAPSVVVLEAARVPSNQGGASILPRGWQSFFNLPRGAVPRGLIEESPNHGSGLIFRTDGYIVTNFHVVGDSDPGGIRVTLQDGREFKAELIGADERSDLAVLKIEADGLVAAEFADSDLVKVGQFAFALGAPSELPYTFTFGLVSATGRNSLMPSAAYQEYIQTDAAINPGNSGGPLCDIDGRVIGINTLISGLNRGLGFAIPANFVKQVATQLVKQGRVIRPWLGISIEGLGESELLRGMFPGVEQGVVVREIHAATPASRSTLQAGDIILEVDSSPVRRAVDVQKIVLARAVGQKVTLKVWREGKTDTVVIPTGEQPDSFSPVAQRRPSGQSPLPNSPMIVPRSEGSNASPPAATLPMTLEAIGLSVQNMDAPMRKSLGVDSEGVIITGVEPNSPAEVGGLQVGDVVTHVGQTAVRSPQILQETLAEIDPQRGALFLLVREGSKAFALVKP